MLQIAEILPREKQGILACFSYEPLLVKQNLQAIHKLIKRARETPIKQLDEQERTLAAVDNRQQETAVEGNFSRWQVKTRTRGQIAEISSNLNPSAPIPAEINPVNK